MVLAGNPLTRIGSFPDVVQTVPTIAQVEEEHEHDLLSDPLKPGFAGGGDLIYHGGATIKGGRVFNVYLGSMSFDTTDFDNFTKALCATYYLSPDQTDKSPSVFAGSAKIPNPFAATVQDTTIKTWLDQHATVINPSHTPDTHYSLVFPAGTIVFLGQDSSCANFCGFHERSFGGIYFAVIDDTMCSGCHGSFTPAQGRMMVHAHEYAEWRSDPNGDAWYDNLGWENADKCAWQGVSWGPWFVQPFWVNGKGAYYGPYAAEPPIVVNISPATATVQADGTQQFTANVPVTWTAARGMISPDGLYKAPNSIGSDVVTARSKADPTKFAQAPITVTSAQPPPPPPPISYREVHTPSGASFSPKLWVQG